MVKNPSVKILIVDDDRIIRHLLKMTLFNTGNYELLESESADSALPIIMAERPDIIIMDVMMPGELNGIKLCRLLKSNPDTRHIKVIVLSAKCSKTLSVESQEAGADFHLAKPFSLDQILKLVSSL